MKRFSRLALTVLPALIFFAVCSTNVSAVTITVPIMNGLDDVEESLEAGGAIDAGSSDIELAVDGPPEPRQLVGLRFRNLGIPRGAPISNAYVQFMVDETDNEADTDVRIFGELAANSAPFTTAAFNLSSRTKTSSSVLWDDIPVWTNPGTGDCAANCPAGPDQRTPNLASIIQQIVNQPTWASGNALSILIQPDPIADNTGERTAVAFERVGGNPALRPATLVVDFVPEPTSCVLALVAGCAAALAGRRRA